MNCKNHLTNFHEIWHKYHSAGCRIKCVQFHFFCNFCHNVGPVRSYRVISHLSEGLEALSWHFPRCPYTYPHTRPIRFHSLIPADKSNFIWKLCINTACEPHRPCEPHVGVCYTSFPLLHGCNAQPHLLRKQMPWLQGYDAILPPPAACLTVSTVTDRKKSFRVQSNASDYQDFTRYADARASG
jgi:hypothetical protein